MNALALILAGAAGAIGGWLVFTAVGRFSIGSRFEEPLTIILSGAVVAGLCAKFGISGRQFLIYAPLTILVAGLTLLDIRRHILPNTITIPGIIAGLALANWLLPLGLRDSLLGAALGGGILLAATVIEAVRKKPLGGGDWKYAAMLGSFIGAQRIVFALVLSGVFGLVGGLTLLLVFRTGAKPTALGPWLSAGAIASLLWK